MISRLDNRLDDRCIYFVSIRVFEHTTLRQMYKYPDMPGKVGRLVELGSFFYPVVVFQCCWQLRDRQSSSRRRTQLEMHDMIFRSILTPRARLCRCLCALKPRSSDTCDDTCDDTSELSCDS